MVVTVADWLTESEIKHNVPQGIIQKLFEIGGAMGRPDILEKAVQVTFTLWLFPSIL